MVQKLQHKANLASLPAEGYVRLPQILAVIPICCCVLKIDNRQEVVRAEN